MKGGVYEFMKNKIKKIINIFVLAVVIIGITVFIWLDGIHYVLRTIINYNQETVTLCELKPTADLYDLLTRDEAIEDIDYIMERLKGVHPAFIKGVCENVAEQSRMEKENFPEQVTVLQLWQAAARIMAVLGDSHTSIGTFYESHYYIPDYFKFTDGRLYCITGEFNGNNVISIGGVRIDDLYRTFISQFPHELEHYAEFWFPLYCRWQDNLLFMNADVSEQVIIVFDTPDGEVSKEFSFFEWERTDDYDEGFVSYEIDKENSIGIFTLTRCLLNDVYRETVRDFFAEVKANQIQTVVIDLRENGGGSRHITNEFIRYLDTGRRVNFGRFYYRYGPIVLYDRSPTIKNNKVKDLLFSGDVYVLTSPRTYSAATIFTTVISDNGFGKIVGETSGQIPQFYGGVPSFQTPNAKLHFAVSSGYYIRPDKSKGDLPLFPDYPSAADEALETVYELVSQNR
jgi:hypothetical protein